MALLRRARTKFEVGDSFSLPTLEGFAGRRALREREPVVLDATYFDTDQRELLSAGITLRRRSGGSDAGWHLKLPRDEAGTRTENQFTESSDGVPTGANG